MCQFLYTCLAFLCIFLWFYVCFSVLKSFWKETEERNKNEQNQIKLQFAEKNKRQRVTNSSFPILAENGLGNWQISFLTSLAIKGTSKLIPSGRKTQKRRRELKEEEFLQYKPL